MRGWTRWLAVLAACVGLAAIAAATAAADPPTITIGPDGETAPVFSYADAIRERVFVQVPGVDQDGDGVDDRVAVDVIRPQETESGLKVPAIVFASPYFTSAGTGESQFLHTTNGVADRFPGWYDNYFVPRGYAELVVEANGTGFSTGCPLHGGPGDIASIEAVIDWLNGRANAYDASGNAVVADWDNGKAGMIGKSYDGTLANGVASTGVAGLTTIVPLSAISNWYDYSRSNGIVTGGSHYPSALSNTITQNQNTATLGELPASRNTLCAGTRTTMNGLDGDATGDFNSFWADRDYVTNASQVHASVFESFGLNDDNVRTDQLGEWWAALSANGVPRKLWLSQEGHIDPFEYRRADWVDTLHRWFDYWLQGVQNGIMSDPQVSIERTSGQWEDDSSWPLPGTSDVDAFLQGRQAGSAGAIGDVQGGGSTSSLTFDDLSGQSETTMINAPTGSQANRLVFLSPVLSGPVHLSGTARFDLHATFNKTGGHLGVILVDYSDSAFTVPSRSNDGVANAGTTSCWGDGTTLDTGCFADYRLPTASVSSWRVSKGILDVQHRTSLTAQTPIVAGQEYSFDFPLLPNDYVFPAGHRIGVIVVSNYLSYPQTRDTSSPTAEVTVDTQLSKLVLPIVGGSATAHDAGMFGDVEAPTLDLPPVVTAEATGAATTVTYTATATDNTDPTPSVSCTPPSGSPFPLGRTTVHCTATDASGNTARDTFDVVVTDTTAPTLSLPSPAPVEATSHAGATVPFTATATDAVDPSVTPVCTPPSGAAFPVGATTVHCTAADASGNVAAGSFVVTVVDTTAPSLSLPSLATVDATSAAGAAVSYTVTATDIADAAVTPVCTPLSGTVFPIGATTVSCNATDASRNVATGSFVVHVADLSAPTLSLPSPATVAATSAAGAQVAYTVTATDTVDSSVAPVCTPASGSTFPLGATTVHCTATDSSGNAGNGSFVVHVADLTAPVLQLPTGLRVGATSPAGTPVTWAATATDEVDGVSPVVCAPRSGALFQIGTTHVSCAATDGAGNVATGAFDVRVSDDTPPVLQLPASMSVGTASPLGTTVTYIATATDVIDGATPIVCTPASGSLFAVGETTVHCTATDAGGNVATGSFGVFVGDIAPPVIHIPESFTVHATGRAGALVTYFASATDLVDASPTFGCTPGSGATFPVGTTAVQCFARDASGNAATATFRVTVVDTDPPVLRLPDGVTAVAAADGRSHVTFAASAFDAIDASPSVECSPASGASFPVGRTVVSCTAADASGNVAHGSFDVVVAPAPAAVLARSLASLLPKTKAGKPLAAELAAVQKRIAKHDTRGACRQLSAFEKDVRARAGKSIRRAVADALIERARRLSVSLGC